jgi:hypothetical protein
MKDGWEGKRYDGTETVGEGDVRRGTQKDPKE